MKDDSLSSREVLREGGSILKDAILNQYQAIIGLGVGAISLISLSPIPALLWLGAELVALPLIDSPPVRRLVQRRRLEKRREEWEAWRRQAVSSLKFEFQARYRQMATLCQQIETNYLGLNGISQLYLSEQREKLDQVLTSCLHRMLAIEAYERAVSSRRPDSLNKEIAQLQRELASDTLPERARAAVAKNIELKQTLIASLEEAKGAQKALATELDSSYSVLEVLLQKSLSMRDPEAISAELDSIVEQAEASERSVREMESLMRSSGVDVNTASIDRMAYPGTPTGTKTASGSGAAPRARTR